MSVSDWFSNFSSKIKVSDSVMEIIRDRRDKIANRINIDFWGYSSTDNHRIFVGSFGRGTKTHFSDIDLLVWLPYEIYCQYEKYYSNGQSALLQAVKNSLKKTYSTTHISGDGQVVELEFTDGIGFEILPAFENTDKSFTYPDTNDGGSWKVTDPRSEIYAINSLDNECNGNVKIFAQMIREWNYTNNVEMPGIIIDILVHNFMKNYGYKDKSFMYYDWFSRDFFKYLSEIPVTQSKFMAMGSNKYIVYNGYFQYKAKVAYNKAIEAIDKEKVYSESMVKSIWREIYGSKFGY